MCITVLTWSYDVIRADRARNLVQGHKMITHLMIVGLISNQKFVFYSGFMLLSTIFQSYEDSVWMTGSSMLTFRALPC